AEAEPVDQSQSLKRIDDLVGTEMRQRVFDLDLRDAGDTADLEPSDHNELDVEQADTQFEPEVHAEDQPAPAPTLEQVAVEPGDGVARANTVARNVRRVVPTNPSFLKREIDTVEPWDRSTSRPLRKSSAIAFNLKRLSGILRGHVEQEVPNVRAGA